MANRPPPQPLTALARDLNGTPVVVIDQDTKYNLGTGASNLLFWFVILALIFWFIFYYVWKPTAVQNIGLDGRPTGQANAGKALLGAALLALLIVFLIWLFRAAR